VRSITCMRETLLQLAHFPFRGDEHSICFVDLDNQFFEVVLTYVLGSSAIVAVQIYRDFLVIGWETKTIEVTGFCCTSQKSESLFAQKGRGCGSQPEAPVTDFQTQIPARVKSHFFCPTTTTSKMARADKSALVKKAVSVIKRGEFGDYSKAAACYGYDRTAISKRIRGLTKTRQEANSFFRQCLTNT
jgi:hypothetical protein